MVGLWGLAVFPLLGLLWGVMMLWRRATIAVRQRVGIEGVTRVEAYTLCHELLNDMVKRAYYLLPNVSTENPTANWNTNRVSADGLLIPSAFPNEPGLLAPLPWQTISGIGVEMSPIFDYAPATRSYWDSGTRVNTGYRFGLLIVPTQGMTIVLPLPLRDNGEALIFGAHVLAYARFHNRRMTLLGFDKALTRSIVHTHIF